jgi:dipeptidyl aminopeptidase/acylaminoacyl peptidase
MPAARWVMALALVILAAAPAAQATFPGRNGGIALDQRTSSGDSAPLVENTRLAVRPPGSADVRILRNCELTDGVPSGGDCTGTDYGSPSYSANGRRIVFDARTRLGLIGAAGGPVTLLPAASTDDGNPAFAPRGDRIVFTGINDQGRSDLYIRNLKSGEARLIVNDATEPAWSSRNALAYVRNGNVYVARPDGTHRRFVTSGVSPDWSPNGRRLVLVRPSPRNTFDQPFGSVYVCDSQGRGLRRVRIGPTDVFRPVWSPDGEWIAYGRFDQGVFAKRLGSGRAARQVAPSQFGSEGAFVASADPAWRPRQVMP